MPFSGFSYRLTTCRYRLASFIHRFYDEYWFNADWRREMNDVFDIIISRATRLKCLLARLAHFSPRLILIDYFSFSHAKIYHDYTILV